MKTFDSLNATRRDVMKGGLGAASLAAIGAGAAAPATLATASVALTSHTAHAQSAPEALVLTQPAMGVLMHPGYARTIAQMAYVWGWPLVNMLNRKAAITQAPQPGLLNGVLPVAPRGQVGMLHDYIEPSENKNLKRDADGSLTLHAGAKSPGGEKESNWLPAPNGRFSLYIRAYWGKEGIFDGSWKPPVIGKVALEPAAAFCGGHFLCERRSLASV